MNPTKKQLLKIAYQRVLAVTIMDMKAPLKWVDEYVSESVTGFGTAADEKIFSKKDYLSIVLNSRKQAKGLFFSCKLKTKYAPRFTGENNASFFDEFVVSVGKGSQQIVMHLLVGLVFTYYENKWKLIALHASIIDTDTSSADTFHLGEAEKKMQELQMEVAKRTEELSQKNNELKIEAALERVRAIAMSMKKADDMLTICKIISQQLQGLGVKEIRNVQTAIFNETKGTYMNYEYYSKHQKTIITEVLFIGKEVHRDQKKFAKSMLAGRDSLYVEQFSGQRLKEWYQYQKGTNQLADRYLLTAHSLNYYWFSLGEIALGISTYNPLHEQEQRLFQRFRNVFDLSYRRYLDIEKAAAQAREAQIEAALERVRAKSMAMQQPNELRDVAELLRKEMGALGIEALETSSIYLVHTNTTECWYAIKDVRQKNTKLLSDYMEIQLGETWVGREMQKFYKGKQKQASIVMKGIHRKEWINYCAGKSSGLKNYYGKEIPERTYHVLKFTGGYMGAVSPGELSEENWDILRRATAVFALAYTRFKDLQEAADRAREAEIELALERVRARSMAMHASSEIMQVVYLIADQLKDLHIEFDSTSIIILHEDAYEYWNATTQQTYINSQLQKIDRTFDGAVNQDILKFSKLTKDFSRSYSKKEKNKHWKWLFRIEGGFKYIPEERKNFILSQPYYNLAVSFTKKIALVLVRYQTPAAYTDSERVILKRFAEVFHQCYTRFLDLQKAEAQAREAQIQLALERVRARTMAMQKSDELAETASLLFQQVKSLGIESYSSGFTIWENNDEELVSWMCNADGSINPPFRMPAKEIDWHRRQYKSWKRKEEYIIHDFQGKGMQEHYAYLKSFPLLHEAFQKSEAAGVTTPPRQVHNAFNFSQGNLLFITLEPVPEAHDIFKRFAKVFEQTYTRFLDLQKAEAQAREAQIEVGLERVRSRAMAMQSSEELKVLIATVFNELTKLDLALTRCIIWVFEPSTKAARWWMANSEEPSNPMTVYVKYHEHPAYLHFVDGWEKQNVKFVYDLKGKDKISWDHILFNETELKLLPDPIKSGMQAPERVLLSASFNNFGGINVASIDPLSDEHFDILLRFARVFDLTYTRFLDLQKAEAQAREAQIEAALERVRSRSLAMHKSDELQEVVTTVFDQLHILNIENDATGIIIFQPNTNHFEYWFANSERSISSYFLLEYKKFSFTNELSIAHQNGEAYFHKVYSKKEKNEFYSKILTETDFTRLSEERKKLILGAEGFTILSPFNKNTALQLNRYYKKPFADTDIEVARRFSNVFEQAYIRFLDLQKAEAQAREAKIEAALERVRSASMAMHKSGDLHEVIKVVSEQLLQLGLQFDSTNFVSVLEDDSWNMWISTPLQAYPSQLYMPFMDHIIIRKLNDAYKKNVEQSLHVFSKKEKDEFFQHFYTKTTAKNIPEERKQYVLNGLGWAISQFCIKNLMLTISNYQGIPFSENDNKIVKRFAKVFEQSYTRFLDLQKAETQAIEAQIEAALERVRSRSLAMHKSDEIMDVVRVVFDKLKDLKIEFDAVSILINHEDKLEYWIANPENTYTTKLIQQLDLFDTGPIINKTYLANWKLLEDYVACFSYEEKQEHWSLLFLQPDFKKIPEERKQFILNAPVYNIACSFTKRVSTVLARYYDKEYSAEDRQILKRFNAVFDQAYVRFLDLQNAEAQAREAQIQLALERVRARTMAMQKSEELAEVSYLLNKQVNELGIATRGCAFNVYNEHDATEWFSNLEGTLPAYRTPRENIFLKYYEAGLRGETLLVEEYGKERIRQHYEYLFSLGFFGKAKNKKETLAKVMPESQVDHVAYFKYGYLLFVTLTPAPEAHDIFKRFAKEFEQTYTRFLDLQKAEAQARESQIQLALERVRARTMAMQKSEELLETSFLLFQQMKELGETAVQNSIAILKEEEGIVELSTTVQGQVEPRTLRVPMDDPHIMAKAVAALKAKQKSLIVEIKGEELKEYNKFRNSFLERKADFPEDNWIVNIIFFSRGWLSFSSNQKISNESFQLLERFAAVFEQTYTRFLDLQKAEAQAREAQIEASLERVRASMMAMHHSEGLPDIMKVILEQLIHLNIQLDVVFFHPTSNEKDWNSWTASTAGAYPTKVYIPYVDHPVFNGFNEGIEQGLDFNTILLSESETKQFWNYFFKTSNTRDSMTAERKAFLLSSLGWAQSIAYKKNATISITRYASIPFSNEDNAILKRFATVFEQSYTRFLDLQKAEAQAREAQIEASLERVRSKAMAMHNSSDLPSTAIIAFSELKKLGFVPIRGGISIQNKESRKNLLYSATTSEQGDNLSIVGWALLDNHPVLIEIYNHWINGEDYYPELHGDLLKSYYEQVSSSFNVPAEQTEIDQYGYFMHFTHGVFYGWCNQPVTEDEKKLLKRFASVIDLTFKRYFDLQKAEAQAREAQIEASLEKVRSVAMSMHHSNELLNICEAIYTELIKLGMIELRNTMINIHNDAEETFLNYDYSAYAGRAVTKYGYHIHPIINHLVMQCRSAQDAFVDIAFDGKEFEEWRSFRKASGEKDDARLKKITHLHYYFYSIGIGSIGISTFESIDEQKMNLLKRFRNVFQLAYQRFTDLSAAEAQAREAQIETALERVRSRTMAMQNSNELSATVQVMFEECRKLQPIATDNFSRGFITTVHQNKKMFDLWITEIDGTKIDAQFKISFDEPTTGVHIHKAWKQKKPYFINDLQGPVLDQWLDYLESTGFKIAPGIRGTRRVNTFIFYSHGFIGITSYIPLEEENILILQRFAKVFDQTYTRFLDLQKAEAAAKEAIKQAALDRIRADIASMRTIEDLNRITPLIWNELTILGVPFIRCGVFIMDQEVEQIHTFLSTPDGKSIAAFHLSFTESENIIDIVHHWRNKKVYSNHWDEKDFDVLADSLVKQKAISTKSTYLQSIPATGIHLNFLPFLQGMLYVGNELPLKPDEIHLLQAVADAFSTAYARYEDFNKLEVAKQVVEKTLNELKATQQQLIQSEKMASLGELTAGIAHEIQNPLNFVNNFSELNVELTSELKDMVRSLDLASAERSRSDAGLEMTALIDDITSNSEKINHHGQRAAAIVKGMLQHSRSSSATKEPTDINALCDEYLRLSYHGLRAKDKSFNAAFKTEFDTSIPKVNIVPQDMGRVILNLINNAFFAVKQRQESQSSERQNVVRLGGSEREPNDDLTIRRPDEEYTPLVTISTRKRESTIEITVSDNGTGIPNDIKEKIFQPFFTTKPTGQGTGLGLSLAYDIVTKAHGGELKVESEEGVGTIFKIII